MLVHEPTEEYKVATEAEGNTWWEEYRGYATLCGKRHNHECDDMDATGAEYIRISASVDREVTCEVCIFTRLRRLDDSA